MPITEVDYNFDDIKENVMGAGIIPIGLDKNDQAYLILGKERYVSHWRGSLKWSGFEGGRKNGETVEYTAAREFIEESLDCIPYQCAYQSDDDRITAIADALRRGEYVARIILCIQPESTVVKRYHVTYLIQVPFEQQYIEDFKTKRQHFVDLINKTEQLGRTVEFIDETFPRENSLFREHMVKAIIGVDCTNTTIVIEFLDDNNIIHTCELANTEESMLYYRWFRLRTVFTSDVQSLALHETAFHEMERNCMGQAIHVRMNDDFVEKQTINWWSSEELQAVIENGGYINNEYFRAYFLPVLQRTLEELEFAGVSYVNHACNSKKNGGHDHDHFV